jgi:membrane-bound metal-dependent hydrolase YbcI (DUF457 family)
MTTDNNKTTGQGRGVLFHDAKLGNLWNSAVAAVITAGVVWLGDIDWSSWPAWVGTLGGPAAGLAVGWLTSRALPRFKR